MPRLTYIILGILLLIGAVLFYDKAYAITGQNVRFDWVLGQPAITADGTAACNNQAVARFDWVLGQPAVVYDATATCTVTADNSAPAGIFQHRSGIFEHRSGSFEIK